MEGEEIDQPGSQKHAYLQAHQSVGIMDANWGGVIAPAVGAVKPNVAPSKLQMTGMMDANWGGVIAPAVGAGKPEAAPSTLQSKDISVSNSGCTLVPKSALSSRKRKKETYLNTGRTVRFNLNHVVNRPNL